MQGLEQQIQQYREAYVKGELSPYVDAHEQSTNEFFSQDVGLLAQALRAYYICDLETGRAILATSTEPWETQKVGERYEAMNSRKLGYFYAFYWPFRKMTQSLIVAQEQGVKITTEDQRKKNMCASSTGCATRCGNKQYSPA